MNTAHDLLKAQNEWVEGMAVRGGMSPLPGLICETVNSVGQGNFLFVRKKSEKSQEISEISGFGNHGDVYYVLIQAVSFL